MLTRLGTFFNWCVRRDLIPNNPAKDLMTPGKPAERDRWLTDAEIRAFWSATGALDAKFCAMFRLLLLTGQRRGEVGGMRWSEVDLENRQWTIPGRRTKNRREHIVHLSEMAIEALGAVPRADGREEVWSPTRDSGWARAKAWLDAAMCDRLAPWQTHDLRRTATTIMARLGVAPHVADKTLNHQSGTIRGVAAVYNRFQYLDERRAALEALGGFVENLVRPGGAGNVVELRRA
jgi:integrase